MCSGEVRAPHTASITAASAGDEYAERPLMHDDLLCRPGYSGSVSASCPGQITVFFSPSSHFRTLATVADTNSDVFGVFFYLITNGWAAPYTYGPGTPSRLLERTW